MADQPTARQAATKLRSEFEDLVREVQQTGSFEHFFQRFDRWKERAVDVLQRQVSPNEAARLRNLPNRANWVQMEPPDVVILKHRAFLIGLIQDIEQHPDSFGGALLLSPSPEGPARSRRVPRGAAPAQPPNSESPKTDVPVTEQTTTAPTEAPTEAPTKLGRPERVTPRWLFHNVDVAWLLTAIAAIGALVIGAFIAGVKVGASPAALRVVGPIINVEAPPDISPTAAKTTPKRDTVAHPAR